MEKITLLILYDEDNKEYSLALGKAISNLHSDFEVTISKSDLNKKYDLTLICGQYDRNRENYSNHLKDIILDYSNYKIYLVEEQVESTPQGHAPQNLYRYTRVQEITSDLRYAYSIISGKKKFTKSDINSKLIGFFSASGGTGKTAVCIGVAQELAKYYDKKVLYLSFEEVESTTYYLKGGNSNRNISDFLYYLFHHKLENICTFIENFIFTNQYGVEAFYPAMGKNELTQLTSEEILHFIKFLGNSNRYDYIVLDLSETLNEQTLELMESCFKTLIIEKDELVSIEKTNKILNYFEKTTSEKFNAGLIKVRNMVISVKEIEDDFNFESRNEELEDPTFLQIENDSSSFLIKESMKEINMDNGFGLGIKEVVRHILGS